MERGTIAVEFLALHDRLLVFSVHDAQLTMASVVIDDATLREAADGFAVSMRRGGAGTSSNDLWRWLIAPVWRQISGNRLLVIVPDPNLGQIPFAALRDPGGHYLIEQIAIALSPASPFARLPRFRYSRSVVAVGEPALDRRMFDLEPLPESNREAQAVAALYSQHRLFTGQAATRENVLRAAAGADVLHFATHAVVVPSDPPASYLALAASDESSGALSVRDIQRATLTSMSLVVLAGCKTAPTIGTAPRASSLALAFLSAGATSVLGTLWDLPDTDISLKMAVRFHEQIRHNADPASALQTMQLEMLRSPDPQRHSPAVWSCFQLYVQDSGALLKNELQNRFETKTAARVRLQERIPRRKR